MFNGFFKDNDEIKLVKSIISLTASGFILFASITYAWFVFYDGPTASDLTLKADYTDCNVDYKIFKNDELISSSQIFTNAKPGDIITYEMEVTNLQGNGLLSVQLLDISYQNSVLINGITHDIRDAYEVNLLTPTQNLGVSLSGQTNVDVLTNYPISQNGVVTVKFNLIFLSNPAGISDVNVFQGNFELKISALKVSIN